MVTCGHCNAEITGASSLNLCIKACKRFRALLPRISSVSSLNLTQLAGFHQPPANCVRLREETELILGNSALKMVGSPAIRQWLGPSY